MVVGVVGQGGSGRGGHGQGGRGAFNTLSAIVLKR